MITLPDGYVRIYHYHVRKTAGTSLNSALWSVIAGDPEQRFREGAPLERDGLVYLHGNYAAIERGEFFFAHAHRPAHALQLPVGTFTVTVFRDPLTRVASYYQYLHYLATSRQYDGALPEELEWASGSFDKFLPQVPKKHLTRQLFMFSSSFSVDEAIERATHVNAVLFTEDFAHGVAALGDCLGLVLPVRYERRFPKLARIDEFELLHARSLLDDEYAFVDAMRFRR